MDPVEFEKDSAMSIWSLSQAPSACSKSSGSASGISPTESRWSLSQAPDSSGSASGTSPTGSRCTIILKEIL